MFPDLGPDWLILLIMAPFIGSFLGLVAERLPHGAKVVLARSHCAHCDHILGPADLVPLLSWLMLRGRCRHCRSAIGAFHPIIELLAIAVVPWAAMVLDGPALFTGVVLGWTLLALAAMDHRHQMLSDALTLPLLGAGLVFAAAWGRPAAFAGHAIGAVAGFIAFAVIGAAYRRLRHRDGLGLGDAKLLAAGGAWVGWLGLAGIVLWAAGMALVVALAKAMAGQGLSPGRRIPFGPYLGAGIWLVWLYGPVRIAW